MNWLEKESIGALEFKILETKYKIEQVQKLLKEEKAATTQTDKLEIRNKILSIHFDVSLKYLENRLTLIKTRIERGLPQLCLVELKKGGQCSRYICKNSYCSQHASIYHPEEFELCDDIDLNESFQDMISK